MANAPTATFLGRSGLDAKTACPPRRSTRGLGPTPPPPVDPGKGGGGPPLRFIRLALLLAAISTLVAALWPRSERTNAAPRGPSSEEPVVARVPPPIGVGWVAGSASIAGTVTETSGVPLATATVCARQTTDALGVEIAATPRCAMVAVDGKYALVDLPAGRWSVSATAPGHLPAIHSFATPEEETTLAPDEALTNVDVSLALGGARVEGIVVDASGAPVAGVIVTATTEAADFVTTTDAGGAFVADLSPGKVTFTAEQPGLADAQVEVIVPGIVRIVMVGESVIAGRVVDAATQLPVVGARVSSNGNYDVPSPGVDKNALTDADGRFRIQGLPLGRYRPTAETIGAKGMATESVVLGPGDVADAVVIAVTPAHHVTGRALLDGKTVCTDGWISLTEKGAMNGGDWRRIGPSGDVLFPAVDDGTYEVSIECGGVESTPKEPLVVDRDLDSLTWSVPRGLAITGTIVDADGRPVPNASLRAAVHDPSPGAEAGSVWSFGRSDGSFEIAGLRATTYDLTVESETASGLVEPLSVTVVDGRDTKDVRVTLPRGGIIDGVVVDRAGRAMAGVRVQLSGTMVRYADTDSSGKFRMIGITPGNVSFTVQRAGRFLATDKTSDDKTVEAVDGQTIATRLVVEETSGEIRGRVVDANGKGVAGAFVACDHNEYVPRLATLSTETSVLTDASGAFTLVGLGTETQVVRARAGAQEAILRGVAVGADVVLALENGGTLEGTVSLADGSVPARFTIEVEGTIARVREDFSGTNGHFVVRALTPGKVTVTVTSSRGGGTAEATLSSNGSATVAVVLSAYRDVVGRAVDERGAPLPYAEVVGVHTDEYATADADGRFVIEGVHGDELEVQLSAGKDAVMIATVLRKIDPTSSARIDLGDVVLRADTVVDHAPDLGEEAEEGQPSPTPTDETLGEGPNADD